jgi:hypothetical protein
MGSETLPEMEYKYLKNKRALAEQSDEIDGGQERTNRRNRRGDLAAERREKRGTEPPLLLCGRVGLWRRRIGASGEEEGARHSLPWAQALVQ